MKYKGSILAVVAAVLLAGSINIAGQTKRVIVKFRAGTSSATYRNTVSGYGSVDFVLRANADQVMSAKLTSSNSGLYFLVLRDDKTNVAIADNARETIDWSGTLPETGNYVVRVYLVRSEARRNKRPVNFTLKLNVQ